MIIVNLSSKFNQNIYTNKIILKIFSPNVAHHPLHDNLDWLSILWWGCCSRSCKQVCQPLPHIDIARPQHNHRSHRDVHVESADAQVDQDGGTFGEGVVWRDAHVDAMPGEKNSERYPNQGENGGIPEKPADPAKLAVHKGRAGVLIL